MSRLDALHERATGPLVDLPATTVVAITAGDLRDLLAFVDDVKDALAPARGTPPDVWAATKDDVIKDVAAALARLDAVTGGGTS